SGQVALNSMMRLASGYSATHRKAPHLYGWHDTTAWSRYLGAIAKLGQTKQHLELNQVVTNQLVKAANAKADVALAHKQGAAFKLDSIFKNTTVPPGYP